MPLMVANVAENMRHPSSTRKRGIPNHTFLFRVHSMTYLLNQVIGDAPSQSVNRCSRCAQEAAPDTAPPRNSKLHLPWLGAYAPWESSIGHLI